MNLFNTIGTLATLFGFALFLIWREKHPSATSTPQPVHIFVNGRDFRVPPGVTRITYEDVVSYTGHPPSAGVYSIVWSAKTIFLGELQGTLTPHNSVELYNGMRFTAVITGDA